MEQLNSMHIALHERIGDFVNRQIIVLQAIRDLRPDMIMQTYGEELPESTAKLRQLYYRTSPEGLWGENSEWKYFLHGSGCRLVNTITDEPLEWDIGNILRFDYNWFINHLAWQINRGQNNHHLVDLKGFLENRFGNDEIIFQPHNLRKMLASEIETLVENGLISQTSVQYRYIFHKRIL